MYRFVAAFWTVNIGILFTPIWVYLASISIYMGFIVVSMWSCLAGGPEVNIEIEWRYFVIF